MKVDATVQEEYLEGIRYQANITEKVDGYIVAGLTHQSNQTVLKQALNRAHECLEELRYVQTTLGTELCEKAGMDPLHLKEVLADIANNAEASTSKIARGKSRRPRAPRRRQAPRTTVAIFTRSLLESKKRIALFGRNVTM